MVHVVSVDCNRTEGAAGHDADRLPSASNRTAASRWIFTSIRQTLLTPPSRSAICQITTGPTCSAEQRAVSQPRRRSVWRVTGPPYSPAPNGCLRKPLAEPWARDVCPTPLQTRLTLTEGTKNNG